MKIIDEIKLAIIEVLARAKSPLRLSEINERVNEILGKKIHHFQITRELNRMIEWGWVEKVNIVDTVKRFKLKENKDILCLPPATILLIEGKPVALNCIYSSQCNGKECKLWKEYRKELERFIMKKEVEEPSVRVKLRVAGKSV